MNALGCCTTTRAACRGVRRARRLDAPTAAEAAAFLRGVPHASGQHYAVVDRSGDAFSLECSAAGATDGAAGLAPLLPRQPSARQRRRRPRRDARPGADRELAPPPGDAGGGRPAVSRSRADCRALLAERTAPICVARADAGNWLTFGAVAMELGDTVTMDVALGPPAETPWLELELGR